LRRARQEARKAFICAALQASSERNGTQSRMNARFAGILLKYCAGTPRKPLIPGSKKMFVTRLALGGVLY
jgi:hypothetical protein